MEGGMKYSSEERWKRLAERSDIKSSVVHLTRELPGGTSQSVIEVLFQILKDRRIRGSTTKSGFIVGDRPAVCFQDAPLSSIVQNLYYEKKLRDAKAATKPRYRGYGLLFDK